MIPTSGTKFLNLRKYQKFDNLEVFPERFLPESSHFDTWAVSKSHNISFGYHTYCQPNAINKITYALCVIQWGSFSFQFFMIVQRPYIFFFFVYFGKALHFPSFVTRVVIQLFLLYLRLWIKERGKEKIVGKLFYLEFPMK